MDRVPYLVINFIQARKLWSVLRPRVEDALASRNLALLYAAPSPPPAPLARGPLTILAEWRGARVLRGEPALESFARALGATTVPGDTPRRALAGGEVDVAFAPAAYAADGKAWEYATHYVHAPAWFPKQLVVVRRDALAALAPASRDAVLAAAAQAGEQAWRLSEEATRDGMQKLRDYGVKTLQPSVDLLIGLENVGRELLFQWSDAAGETGAHLVEAYYAVR
jgi:TRAP-type C4-dicarboxylate transport system substrate-binding protein